MSKKARAYLSWILSYLLVLMFPLGAIIATTAMTTRTLRSEENRYVDLAIEQNLNSLDTLIDEVRYLGAFLRRDMQIKNYLSRTALTDVYGTYSLWNIGTNLQSQIGSNEHASECCIYIKDLDKALYNLALYDVPLLLNTGYSGIDYSESQFRDMLSAPHWDDLVMLERKDGTLQPA